MGKSTCYQELYVLKICQNFVDWSIFRWHDPGLQHAEKNGPIFFTSKLRRFSSTWVSYGNIVMAPLDAFFWGGLPWDSPRFSEKPRPKNLGWVLDGFLPFLVGSVSRLGFFQQEMGETSSGKNTQVTATACAPAQRLGGVEVNNVKPGDVSGGCTTKYREYN